MDVSSKVAAASSKDSELPLTDTTIAQGIVQNAFPVRSGRNIKAAIGDAFEALRRRERALPVETLRARPRQWTERRVKALWHQEARRVDHYEIEDLTAVAVEEARIERQRLRAREARLEALLASAVASDHREDDQQIGGMVGGLDRAPSGAGTDADAEYDQREYRRD